jgi:hypothetical protein
MSTDTNNDPLIGEAIPRRKVAHAPLPNGMPPVATAPVDDAPRETFREEDPRTRAARRAAELRDHGSVNDDGTDEFYIDPRIIPDGWSYEYKRYTVLGAQEPSYQVQLALKGWESVPAARHPELMPDNYSGMTIERKGMILMERPAEITNEVKARELRKAREQVGQKEQQLNGMPAGPNSPFESNSKIGRSYETIAVPK